MNKPFINTYQEQFYKGFDETLTTDYNEPFDAFCRALVATSLLDKEQKQLIRELINQWEHNNERSKGDSQLNIRRNNDS